jgi:cysteine synthase A
MSTGNSVERVRMMTAFGAKVELVPQAPGSTPGKVSGIDLALVDQRAQELVEQHGAFRTDQFEHPANPIAHEHGTGMEILRQTGGNLTAFVDFVGSAGTLIGTARTLKAWSPEIKCYAVEPVGAAFLAGEPVTRPNHKIQGGGYARRLSFFDRALCDGFLKVDDEDAIAVARKLAQREGIFGGFSTGANVAAALQLLNGPHRGGTIVCVAPDSGLKYLSTDLYSREI